ncbi:hypothetical protein BaRGS_00014249 [Batillaria attramentaria]|uniref:Uncharacterized protein n=1 Tax=Batillaria attramentaria TaxID=370345 RepID=A0ABD0L5L7_9CAEN
MTFQFDLKSQEAVNTNTKRSPLFKICDVIQPTQGSTSLQDISSAGIEGGIHGHRLRGGRRDEAEEVAGSSPSERLFHSVEEEDLVCCLFPTK